MLPADLQVALLLAQTAHSPLTPTLAEQGLLSSVGAWDPTRSASVGSSLFPGAPSPATPLHVPSRMRVPPYLSLSLPSSILWDGAHARKSLYVPRAENQSRVRRYVASFVAFGHD